MDSISDLATTLQFLQSDKVTERKVGNLDVFIMDN